MKTLFILFVSITYNIKAQTVTLLTSGAKSSLRGLSVVSENIIWASGSNGTIAKSVDGGSSWRWFTAKGFEKTDFRDIEAFDSLTAIVMGVGDPAIILKTSDGGYRWKVVYQNNTKGMFLDAMDFPDRKNGIVVGDPVTNSFFIARTINEGNSWHEVPAIEQPLADTGEACFAASGTNVRMNKSNEVFIVSGGLRSRLFIDTRAVNVPILQGRSTAGANSIALKNKKTFIVVGGDYNTPDSAEKVCVITNNKGKAWSSPAIPPHGYRSCIEYVAKKSWITCGSNGVDYSTDDGKTWQWISRESFNVCRKAKTGTLVFFAGAGGKIGKAELF